MQLRYRPGSVAPHAVGGVDEYDLYVTAAGTPVVRFGSAADDRLITTGNPTRPDVWANAHTIPSNRWSKHQIAAEKAERIALMFKLFGPEWEE